MFLTGNYTLTIQQMINGGIEIFDFNYPIFDNQYKPIFEKLFIDYFLLEEIGHETVGQFKLRLENKLNLIMPMYNKIYESQLLEQRILDNYDVQEEITRVNNSDLLRNLKGNTSNTSNSTRKNLYKDAPKTRIDINNFDVVTNLSKDLEENNINTINNDSENITNNSTEKYTRTTKGNIGVQTDADAIIKYWASLRNVTLEIFENELSQLFMGVF